MRRLLLIGKSGMLFLQGRSGKLALSKVDILDAIREVEQGFRNTEMRPSRSRRASLPPLPLTGPAAHPVG